ncbi:MAG: MFS transporter [Propionibacteriaceae bacterium]|jgi:MFS family permease|nr:MFS transporter [Propionibacteriaceae bacterium]
MSDTTPADPRLPSPTSDLIHDRPYVVLLVARTIAMMGFAFAPVALAFGLLDLPGGDAHLLSTVLTAQLGPKVVLSLFGGVVADRYPRVRVLQIGIAVVGLGWVALGLMMLTGLTWTWLMCLAAGLTGIAESVLYPALTGIIPEVVPPLLLQQGNAWLSMGASAARLAGLVGSGAMVVLLGGGWAVVVAGALYLTAGVVALGLPVAPAGANPAESPLRQLIAGWGEFSSRQWIWVCTAQYAFVVMMLQAAHGVLGPVIAKAELGGPKAWTTVLVGEAVGAVLGVVVSLVWRPRRPIFTGVLVTFFAGVPPVLLGLGAPVLVTAVAAVGMGLGFELFGVLWMTALQREVPPDALSRVAAYDAFGSIMFGPIGLIIAAPAADWLGLHPALIGCGGTILLVTALAALSPEVRRLKGHVGVR